MSERDVRIRFFASLVDQTGTQELTLPADPNQTLTELWERLCVRYPKLLDIGFRPLIACDMEFTQPDARVGETREVAFLPPVSGG